ncbi:hypothetical protein [Sphingobium aromaticiconvertens]|uniref:hypothetical protein n=1 Tax=Sphingobium aromaticiconvertens TaxID=365341 RepID=UPI00301909D6
MRFQLADGSRHGGVALPDMARDSGEAGLFRQTDEQAKGADKVIHLNEYSTGDADIFDIVFDYALFKHREMKSQARPAAISGKG